MELKSNSMPTKPIQLALMFNDVETTQNEMKKKYRTVLDMSITLRRTLYNIYERLQCRLHTQLLHSTVIQTSRHNLSLLF